VRVLARACAVQRVTAVQSEYSLSWRRPEGEVLPVREDLGIGFVPCSPLGRGFLTSAIDEHTTIDSADNRKALTRFTVEARKANQALVDRLRTIGERKGATSTQLALAWLLARATWIVPPMLAGRSTQLPPHHGALPAWPYRSSGRSLNHLCGVRGRIARKSRRSSVSTASVR
jgi:aryl-alcohol dehydrogenase-like predicted oxidoreductase